MIKHIINQDFLSLQEDVHTQMNEISKYIIESIQENVEDLIWESLMNIDNPLLEARFKIVNRVRAGKIQRRKRVSNVKGYRFQDGRLVRMTPQEKMKRIRGQRKAKIKRKAKLGRSLQRRKISIRRRGNL